MDSHTIQIITRSDAELVGQKWYFTGLECQNGHLDKRYVNTGICYSCKRKQNNRDYRDNNSKRRQIGRRSYYKNWDKRQENSKRWSTKNLEKCREIKRRNKIKYHDEYLEAEKKRYKIKRDSDPFFRLSRNISKALWEWLKGSKNYRHWEDVVGYNVDTLRIHLEQQFRDGMTWENYGQYWHVDHIKPLVLCSEISEAWALSNLQPLLKFENLSKNAKYPYYGTIK